MGMLDGRPFIPKTGAPVWFNHRRYVLRWTIEYGRALFSYPWATDKIAPKPAYRLVSQTKCCVAPADTDEKPCVFHFDVYSIRTGKRCENGQIVCYMVRVDKDDPTVKRPWWHDYHETFVRGKPWHL